MSYELSTARSNMIEQQVRPWDVLDQRVLESLSNVLREDFVDEQYQGIAYSDFPLPIGFGQHMLKPTVDGRLLQALLLQPSDSVLEIGTGSGYLTACLANLCAHVDSIELIPELVKSASSRLAQSGVANAVIRQQDAAMPWEANERYDGIAFSGAIPGITDFYRNKLKVGGRLFAFIGEPSQPTMDATLLTRVAEKEWSQDVLFEAGVEALVNFDSDSPNFVF